ncbi:MAG: hypothetical protein ACI9BD_000069, partial [Candidatus Marinamargulisbacteria bacterium]
LLLVIIQNYYQFLDYTENLIDSALDHGILLPLSFRYAIDKTWNRQNQAKAIALMQSDPTATIPYLPALFQKATEALTQAKATLSDAEHQDQKTLAIFLVQFFFSVYPKDALTDHPLYESLTKSRKACQKLLLLSLKYGIFTPRELTATAENKEISILTKKFRSEIGNSTLTYDKLQNFLKLPFDQIQSHFTFHRTLLDQLFNEHPYLIICLKRKAPYLYIKLTATVLFIVKQSGPQADATLMETVTASWPRFFSDPSTQNLFIKKPVLETFVRYHETKNAEFDVVNLFFNDLTISEQVLFLTFILPQFETFNALILLQNHKPKPDHSFLTLPLKTKIVEQLIDRICLSSQSIKVHKESGLLDHLFTLKKELTAQYHANIRNITTLADALHYALTRKKPFHFYIQKLKLFFHINYYALLTEFHQDFRVIQEPAFLSAPPLDAVLIMALRLTQDAAKIDVLNMRFSLGLHRTKRKLYAAFLHLMLLPSYSEAIHPVRGLRFVKELRKPEQEHLLEEISPQLISYAQIHRFLDLISLVRQPRLRRSVTTTFMRLTKVLTASAPNLVIAIIKLLKIRGFSSADVLEMVPDSATASRLINAIYTHNPEISFSLLKTTAAPALESLDFLIPLSNTTIAPEKVEHAFDEIGYFYTHMPPSKKTKLFLEKHHPGFHAPHFKQISELPVTLLHGDNLESHIISIKTHLKIWINHYESANGPMKEKSERLLTSFMEDVCFSHPQILKAVLPLFVSDHTNTLFEILDTSSHTLMTLFAETILQSTSSDALLDDHDILMLLEYPQFKRIVLELLTPGGEWYQLSLQMCRPIWLQLLISEEKIYCTDISNTDQFADFFLFLKDHNQTALLQAHISDCQPILRGVLSRLFDPQDSTYRLTRHHLLDLIHLCPDHPRMIANLMGTLFAQKHVHPRQILMATIGDPALFYYDENRIHILSELIRELLLHPATQNMVQALFFEAQEKNLMVLEPEIQTLVGYHLVQSSAMLDTKSVIEVLRFLNFIPHQFSKHLLETLTQALFDHDEKKYLEAFFAEKPLLAQLLLTTPEMAQSLFTLNELHIVSINDTFTQKIIQSLSSLPSFKTGIVLKNYLPKTLPNYSLISGLIPETSAIQTREDVDRLKKRILETVNQNYQHIKPDNLILNIILSCYLNDQTLPKSVYSVSQVDISAYLLKNSPVYHYDWFTVQLSKSPKLRLKTLNFIQHYGGHWQSALTSNFIQGWETKSSAYHILKSSILTPKEQMLLQEFLIQITDSLADCPENLSSDHLSPYLEILDFVVTELPRFESTIVQKSALAFSKMCSSNPSRIISLITKDVFSDASKHVFISACLKSNTADFLPFTFKHIQSQRLLFPVWNDFILGTDNQFLLTKVLIPDSELDLIVCRLFSTFLKQEDPHLFDFCDPKPGILAPYLSGVLQRIETPLEGIFEMARKATMDKNMGFLTVFIYFLNQQMTLDINIIPSLYELLKQLGKIQIDSTATEFSDGINLWPLGEQAVIAAYQDLYQEGYIEQYGYLTPNWTGRQDLKLVALREEINHHQQFENAKNRIVATLNAAKTFRQTLLRHVAIWGVGLLVKDVDQESDIFGHLFNPQIGAAHPRFIDDFVSAVFATQSSRARSLFQNALSELPFPKLADLFLCETRNIRTKTHLLQALLPSDQGNQETYAASASSLQKFFQWLIKNHINVDLLPERKVAIQESILAFFMADPELAVDAILDNKPALLSAFQIDLDRLIECHSRLVDDPENPLRLLKIGFEFLDILVVSQQLGLAFSPILQSIEKGTHIPLDILSGDNERDVSDHHLSVFIKATLNPGLQIGRIPRALESPPPEENQLLEQYGAVDSYGLILQTDRQFLATHMDPEHVETLVIDEKNHPESELKSNPELLKKECLATVNRLQEIVNSHVRYKTLNETAVYLSFRFLQSFHEIDSTSPQGLPDLSLLNQGLTEFNVPILLTPRLQHIIHDIFAPTTPIPPESNTSPAPIDKFLEQLHIGFTRSDIEKSGIEAATINIFIRELQQKRFSVSGHSGQTLKHIPNAMLPHVHPQKRERLGQAFFAAIQTKRNLLRQILTIQDMFYRIVYTPPDSYAWQQAFVSLFLKGNSSKERLIKGILYHKDQSGFAMGYQKKIKVALGKGIPQYNNKLAFADLKKYASVLAYQHQKNQSSRKKVFREHPLSQKDPQPGALSKLIAALEPTL